MPVGKLIVIEGTDGTGKSSLSTSLVEKLASKGVDAIHHSFPGKTEGSLGEVIYRLHHDPSLFSVKSITPAALQALHIAAHFDAIEIIIRPLLNRGVTVILDRYWWSTWVYGKIAGVPEESLNHLIAAENSVWANCKPAAAILLERNHSLKESNYDEWNKLKELYAILAIRESTRYPVHRVSNDSSPSILIESVWRVLKAIYQT